MPLVYFRFSIVPFYEFNILNGLNTLGFMFILLVCHFYPEKQSTLYSHAVEQINRLRRLPVDPEWRAIKQFHQSSPISPPITKRLFSCSFKYAVDCDFFKGVSEVRWATLGEVGFVAVIIFKISTAQIVEFQGPPRTKEKYTLTLIFLRIF